MALITCNECKKEISDTAKKCPNCGIKIKSKRKTTIFIFSIIGLCLIFITSFFVFKNFKNQEHILELKSQAKIIEDKISSLMNNDITDFTSIVEIKNLYDSLNNG